MDFHIIDTTCAVLSLIISIYTATQVISIKSVIKKSQNSIRQNITGKGNNQSVKM